MNLESSTGASSCSSIRTVYIGDDWLLPVQLEVFDSCCKLIGFVDLSAATEIEALFKKADDTTLIQTLTDNNIVLTNGPLGAFNIIVAAADSADLAASETGLYTSIEIRYTIAGKVQSIILTNAILIAERLFPDA